MGLYENLWALIFYSQKNIKFTQDSQLHFLFLFFCDHLLSLTGFTTESIS